MLSTVSILPQHPQHRLVGAAVQRPVQRRHPGRDGGVGIDLRGADAANGVGRAVLLVVGVQDEEHVERLGESRVGLVGVLHLEQHREEVLGVVELVVGVDVGEAEAVPVGERRQRRHLGDQPDRRHVALLGIVDVLGVWIEGRQRPDLGEQHPHRMGVVAEALVELLDVLVDEGVVDDVEHPAPQLRLGRQLAEDEQVGDLEIARVLTELLDGNPAMLEDPRLAVDVGDRRAAGGGVEEGRVVPHQPEVVVVDLDLAQIHGADGAVGDLELVVPARSVVGDRKRVAARRSPRR